MSLTVLQADVQSRAEAISASVRDWPCRKGCDRCCRSLAQLPRATQAEWALAEVGLAQLSADESRQIDGEIAKLIAGPRSRPIVCPFLDRATGACRIYLASPHRLPHLWLFRRARQRSILRKNPRPR